MTKIPAVPPKKPVLQVAEELLAQLQAKVAAEGRTLDEWLLTTVQDYVAEPVEPPKQEGRPLWDVLPRIDRLIRDEVPYTEELFIALMKELDWSRGSKELEIQAEVWQIAWCEGKKLVPMDTFMRGCCTRDREDWEASLPKLTLPKG